MALGQRVVNGRLHNVVEDALLRVLARSETGHGAALARS
jgi:hypothetical protein